METTTQFLTPFISRTAFSYFHRLLPKPGTRPHKRPPITPKSNIPQFLQTINNTTSTTIPIMITYFLPLPSIKIQAINHISAIIIPTNNIISFFPILYFYPLRFLHNISICIHASNHIQTKFHMSIRFSFSIL